MCLALSHFLSHKRKCDSPWLIGYTHFIHMGLMSQAQRCGTTWQSHTATCWLIWDQNSQLPNFQPGMEWTSWAPMHMTSYGPHPTCTEDPGLQHSLGWEQQAFLQESWLLRAVQAGLLYLLLSLISFVGDERQVPGEDQCIRAHYSIIALNSSAKSSAHLCCQPTTIN